MTSKSFKGLLSANELNVVGYGDSPQVDLLIRRSDRAITSTGIAIARSDAPALALAILEAAGVENVPHDIADGSERALGYLIEYVGLQQANERHAKEQAELEAEALALCLARWRVNNKYQTNNIEFSDLSLLEQKEWLAVARCDREMRAEK